MKVLLTGADGQLGRALTQFAPECLELVAVTRKDCDLSDTGAVSQLLDTVRPMLILNAAAYTAVDKAEEDTATAYAVNRDAVGVMADWGETRLVHISTDYVFDGASARPYRPQDPRNPLSTYGKSKAAGEDRLREKDLLVRTSWLYAAGGANFVRTMLRLMADPQRSELRVVADQIGAPTCAAGLARTVWQLVGVQACGTFHHSDAGCASWYDFAVATAEEARAIGLLDRSIIIIPITTADHPTPAPRPAFSLLDCSETRALLGDGYLHWRENLRQMLREEASLG